MKKIRKRSIYFLHVIMAILLVMISNYYGENYLNEDLEALVSILSFVYLVVVGYKFIFYEKYIASFKGKNKESLNQDKE